MRAVVDTNVLISATGWEGNARELLRKASRGDLALVISEDILAEYMDVIRREKFSFLDQRKVKRFVLLLLEFIQVMKVRQRVKVVDGDPEDDLVLACARAAKADLVVTGDKHLLELGKWSGIRIVSCREALDLIG